MNTMEFVMKRLGLTPPPPPREPPAFLEERTAQQIGAPTQMIWHPPRYSAGGLKTHEGWWERVPVRGPVTYDERFHDVWGLGLDPNALQESYQRLQANLKRMRRDAQQARGLAGALNPATPIFGLRG